MSPKFYGSLWIVFAASAGVLWLANFFTLLTLVVFGFIAFGLVFAGMICVLPGTVSHPTANKEKGHSAEREPQTKTFGKPAHTFRSYRSA